MPTLDSFEEHVIEALALYWNVDIHVVAVMPQGRTALSPWRGREHLLHALIHVAYKPKTLQLIHQNETEGRFDLALLCNLATHISTANRRGEVSVLLQWVALEMCYDAVVDYERSTSLYDWIVRLRTDLVYLEALPLAYPLSLGTANVYVPSGGMTVDSDYRCMNDMVFICPRNLCRPYFKMLELWQSPLCVKSHLTGLSTIFAPSADMPNGQFAPPTKPYLVPQTPNASRGNSWAGAFMSAQWYFFARYVRAPARPCLVNESTSQCCGLIREFAWPYAIRRRRGYLECQHRLMKGPSRRPHEADSIYRPNFFANASAYLNRCLAVEKADLLNADYCSARIGYFGPYPGPTRSCANASKRVLNLGNTMVDLDWGSKFGLTARPILTKNE
eukprot:CAMPEP_0119307544 /NCGR_PEP_ID=MMETSP1333-20130426/8013_1 /TAXON_ID=418940 /ORGANISM="Scyphosphaera apsteinii, Strain RCC1455" /LENGTH=388 /DNA_ID=CAMNT_0007311115 /DNA_START=177 /DNA_END=1343 /DNA_ORIENTATION=-